MKWWKMSNEKFMRFMKIWDSWKYQNMSNIFTMSFKNYCFAYLGRRQKRENLDKKKKKSHRKTSFSCKISPPYQHLNVWMLELRTHTHPCHTFRPNNNVNILFFFCFKNFVWLQAGKKTKKPKKPNGIHKNWIIQILLPMPMLFKVICLIQKQALDQSFLCCKIFCSIKLWEANQSAQDFGTIQLAAVTNTKRQHFKFEFWY